MGDADLQAELEELWAKEAGGKPHCPEHGAAATEESRDPNGDRTGDLYCSALRCGWVWMGGWGYDG